MKEDDGIRLVNIKYLILGLFITILCVFNGTPVNAQASYDVRGYVVNETRDSVIPEGLEIILHTFDPEGGPVETKKSSVDNDGYFEFLSISQDSNLKYFLTVEHESFIYNKEVLSDSLSDPIKISVYDKTLDPTVVTFDTHIFVIADISSANQTVSVVEFIKFTNNSDKTLIPDMENVPPITFVRFSMPDNFTELDVQTDLPGGQIISVGTGFAVTSPITPGNHQISFSYLLEYEEGKFDYEQKLIHGAEFFQAMIPDRLSGTSINMDAEQTSLDIEGTAYSAWNLYEVEPGDGPLIMVEGLPDATMLDVVVAQVSSKGFWRISIPVSVVIVLLVIVPWLVLRARKEKNV